MILRLLYMLNEKNASSAEESHKKIFLHPARILYDISLKKKLTKILRAYFEVLGYNSTMKH